MRVRGTPQRASRHPQRDKEFFPKDFVRVKQGQFFGHIRRSTVWVSSGSVQIQRPSALPQSEANRVLVVDPDRALVFADFSIEPLPCRSPEWRWRLESHEPERKGPIRDRKPHYMLKWPPDSYHIRGTNRVTMN